MAPVFLFLMVVVAMVALAFWLMVWNGKRTVANLAVVAQRLGLNLVEKRFCRLLTGAELHGAIGGRAVRFWQYTTGQGKSRNTWVAVGLRPRQDGGLTFGLSRQGITSGLAELFGAKEITLGDKVFDDAWFIETNQPEFLAAALVPEIRARLMAVHGTSHWGSFRLVNGEVVYVESGGFSGVEQMARLEAALPVLLDLADVAEVMGRK